MRSTGQFKYSFDTTRYRRRSTTILEESDILESELFHEPLFNCIEEQNLDIQYDNNFPALSEFNFDNDTLKKIINFTNKSVNLASILKGSKINFFQLIEYQHVNFIFFLIKNGGKKAIQYLKQRNDNENSIHFGKNALWQLAYQDEYELIEYVLINYFDEITSSLFDCIKNPKSPHFGKNILWIFAQDEQFLIISHIIDHDIKNIVDLFSPIAGSKNCQMYGQNILWFLLNAKQYDIIKKLVYSCPVEILPLFEVELSIPGSIYRNKNLLWAIAFHNQNDIFQFLVEKNGSKIAPLLKMDFIYYDNNQFSQNIFWLLVYQNQYDLVQSLIDYLPDEIFTFLNVKITDPHDIHFGENAIWTIVYDGEFELIEMLIEKNNKIAFSLLTAENKNPDSLEYGKSALWLIALYQQTSLLEKLFDENSSEFMKYVGRPALHEDCTQFGKNIIYILFSQCEYNFILKILDFDSPFIMKVLKNTWTPSRNYLSMIDDCITNMNFFKSESLEKIIKLFLKFDEKIELNIDALKRTGKPLTFFLNQKEEYLEKLFCNSNRTLLYKMKKIWVTSSVFGKKKNEIMDMRSFLKTKLSLILDPFHSRYIRADLLTNVLDCYEELSMSDDMPDLLPEFHNESGEWGDLFDNIHLEKVDIIIKKLIQFMNRYTFYEAQETLIKFGKPLYKSSFEKPQDKTLFDFDLKWKLEKNNSR